MPGRETAPGFCLCGVASVLSARGGVARAEDGREFGRLGRCIADRLSARRVFIRGCGFDAAELARGIDAPKLCRSEYDDKPAVLRPRPVHDWSSHAADALRFLALTLERRALKTGFGGDIDHPKFARA